MTAGAPTLYPFTKIIGMENIEFGSDVLIDDFVLIVARKPMRIGSYVHIACFSSITGGEEVSIGDCCALSQGARLLTATDDFTDWGIGNSTIPEEYRNVRRAPITLERFSIIGANAVVLPGITIGEGAAVGAGSVVTRDLEPWGVYVGNRRLRDRDRAGALDTLERFSDAGRPE
jgi:galactoside O-acetyltransferase